MVVRFQGGHNAGHTLVVGEQTYKLSLLPSGIVRGTPSVIGNGVVLDPWHLKAEIERMREQGVEVTPDVLMIADNCPLILPIHRDLDALREDASGAGKIGTTRRGIGPAYEDKVGRRAIRLMDLADLPSLTEKIEGLLAHHNALRRGNGLEEIKAKTIYDELAAVAPKVLPYMDTVWALLDGKRREGKRILFEGAQGALLDVDHGTYPYVTSSNTTAGGASVGAGIGPTMIDGVLGVVKAYTTRVGNGPLPTLADAADEEKLRQVGGEFGSVTGRPRRCGWFDAMVVRYAARVNGLTALAVTKLDVLDVFDQVQVGTGYEVDGKVLEEMPSEVSVLGRVRPVYETLPGWGAATGAARTLADLPRGARVYLDRLEALAGVEVRYVSVGTRRDQIIDCRG